MLPCVRDGFSQALGLNGLPCGGAPSGLMLRPGHASTPRWEASHPPIELGYLVMGGTCPPDGQVSLERR